MGMVMGMGMGMGMATPSAAGCSSWQMVKSFLMLPRFMASTFWSRMWKPPPPPHKRLRMLLLYGAKGAAAATYEEVPELRRTNCHSH